MQDDPVRQKIRDLLWRRGMNMRAASIAIGRNVSYLHGFLERGTPRVLGYQDAARLAGVLGCEASELHHAERPPRRKRMPARAPGRGIFESAAGALAGVPEVAVEASAGPGALNGEHIEEQARWFLPEAMIRYEAGGAPDAVRVLRVRGVSMEPELSDGDRLLVDTSRQAPAIGEMFVLWDGSGLVVKRVELGADDSGKPVLLLKSANPDYADYTVLVADANIVGKVLWIVRKT